MKTINLRDYYPHYKEDEFYEVPDDVADLLREFERKEKNYIRKIKRYRAYFSLDVGDKIESETLLSQNDPADILELRMLFEIAYQSLDTSLPTGGDSTNVALAGHTGYFGRVVFDNIPYLSEGDRVSITTYFCTLNYRVISKKEISSTETNDIYVVKGKDLLTLLTCARMGRTRYEVVCERV